jgi:hypothetical protein
MTRLVQLAFRGVHGFTLTAQFLQAGTYGREVVGSTRSVHGVSSQLGRVLLAQYVPGPNARRGYGG